MSCVKCKHFVNRLDMDSSTDSRTPSWYNVFRQDDESVWDKLNGCSKYAFFIPYGTENNMEICKGKLFARRT